MSEEKRGNATALYIVKIKLDKVTAEIAEVMRMLPVARSQPANVNLDVHQDVTELTRLMFYENWTSEEELSRWVATPEMKAYFERLSPMFEGEPDITHWRMISKTVTDAKMRQGRAEQIVHNHIDLFAPEGDLNEWANHWHEDVVAEFPFAPDKGFPKEVRGLAAWREMCRGIKQHLPDYQIEDLEVYATYDPDIVLAEWRGVSAKADYDQHYAVKFVMRGDKVAHYWEYFNAAALAKGGMLR